MDEVTESSECARAFNGAHEFVAHRMVGLAESERFHVVPSRPRFDALKLHPPFRFGVDVDRGILPHRQRIGDVAAMHVDGPNIDECGARLADFSLEERTELPEVY